MNAVVRAMITGDRSGLESELTARYRDAGVAHILAVSGLHLAVVTLLAFVGVRRVWATIPGLSSRVRPNLVATLTAAPAALGYGLITGGRISTMRALLVVLVVLAGVGLARRARGLDALGLAALVLLMYRPASLFDPSFQLSFAATSTLILVAGRNQAQEQRYDARPTLVYRVLHKLWRTLRGLLGVSMWATLATAPFTALAFGQIAIAGVLTNLFAVPLVELFIVPLGVAGAALSPVCPDGGGMLIDGALVVAGTLDAVVAWAAELAPSIPVFPPSSWELLGAGAAWIGAIGWARSRDTRTTRRSRGAIALGVAIMVGSYLVSLYVTPHLQTDVQISFLDVGQGDAAVIQVPGGQVWMIDGGGLPFVNPRITDDRERRRQATSPGRLSVARFLSKKRIRRIHRLVISHPHPDHYEGLHALIGKVAIDEVWVARQLPELPLPPSYRELLASLRQSGASIYHPQLDTPYVDGQVSLTVLAPRYLDDRATADPVSGHNDNSLVVRLDAFTRRVLFAGDIEREGEDLLVAHAGERLRADIVKVPHHGSRSSSSLAFVNATTPGWAMISCGVANRFDFPAAEVVNRWREAGARVLQTNLAGAITVLIQPDGRLKVRVFDSQLTRQPAPW